MVSKENKSWIGTHHRKSYCVPFIVFFFFLSLFTLLFCFFYLLDKFIIFFLLIQSLSFKKTKTWEEWKRKKKCCIFIYFSLIRLKKGGKWTQKKKLTTKLFVFRNKKLHNKTIRLNSNNTQSLPPMGFYSILVVFLFYLLNTFLLLQKKGGKQPLLCIFITFIFAFSLPPIHIPVASRKEKNLKRIAYEQSICFGFPKINLIWFLLTTNWSSVVQLNNFFSKLKQPENKSWNSVETKSGSMWKDNSKNWKNYNFWFWESKK